MRTASGRLRLPRLKSALSGPDGRRRLGVAAGALALLGAETAALRLPPGLLTICLAGLATGLLAMDRRLGPLGAALLVVVAMPFGRAADIDVFRVGALPIRPHDVVIAIGVLLVLPAVWGRVGPALSRRRQGLRGADPMVAAPILVVLVFLAVGAAAVGIGVLNRYDGSDIVRDIRWWVMYGAVPLAVLGSAGKDRIVRALLLGAAVFASLMLAVALLPEFPGGLKDRASTYDWGQLRLQFSNDVFVLSALGYSAFRLMRRPSAGYLLLAILLASAITLSLTRMSMLAAAGILGLVALFALAGEVKARRWRRAALGSACVAGSALAGVALALSVLLVVPAAAGSSQPGGASLLFDRITFSDPGSNGQAINSGRFEAYRRAASTIGRAPVTGGGMGTLVYIGEGFGNTRMAKPGYTPGVDDAYLTVALKAGLIGVAAFVAVLLLPVFAWARGRRRSLWLWYLPVWLGLMALTVTQAFASSGYGPFPFALLLAVPFLGGSRSAVAVSGRRRSRP